MNAYLCVSDAGSVEEAEEIEERQPRYGAHVDLSHQGAFINTRNIDMRVVELATDELSIFDMNNIILLRNTGRGRQLLRGHWVKSIEGGREG